MIAVRRLNLVVDRLASSLGGAEEEAVSTEDWEVVEAGHPVESLPGIEKATPATRIVEEGPGQIPQSLVVFAKQRLTSRGGGPLVRARRAWSAGFWARVALDTHTPYSKAPSVDVQSSQWVCLSGCRFGVAKRTTRKIDLTYLLVGSEAEQIWEEFPSFTELSIFCVAAGIDIPELVKWSGAR